MTWSQAMMLDEWHTDSTCPQNKDLEKLLAQIDSEASTVDINNSDCFPASQDMTVEDWLSHNHYDGLAAEFFRHFVRALVGREAREVGLHYILDYIKSGGGFLSLASEGPDGAQSLKIRQGKDIRFALCGLRVLSGSSPAVFAGLIHIA